MPKARTYSTSTTPRRGQIDTDVDLARRELWRAYQRGQLSEDELASMLDRLEYMASMTERRPALSTA